MSRLQLFKTQVGGAPDAGLWTLIYQASEPTTIVLTLLTAGNPVIAGETQGGNNFELLLNIAQEFRLSQDDKLYIITADVAKVYFVNVAIQGPTITYAVPPPTNYQKTCW